MKWKPLIAGVDGSPESVRAAVAASMLARRAGTSCTLVAALPDYARLLAGPIGAASAHETARGILAHDREMLTHSLRGFVGDRTVDTLELRTGRPAVILPERARQLGAGLIAVGSRPGNRRSLVPRLVHAEAAPVLVVDAGSPVIHRILVALDLSHASEPVLEIAREWARVCQATLRAIHVIEPTPLATGASLRSAENYYLADEALRQSALWVGIDARNEETVVRRGDAHPSIRREAEEWGANLVVIGSHGMGWAERFMIGGNAEHLVLRPAAATLVVPAARPASAEALEPGLAAAGLRG
jgi:nucleotide-binding universal stress UspA family protein